MVGSSRSTISTIGHVKPDAPPAQLYNLKTDRAETTNLYTCRPGPDEHLAGTDQACSAQQPVIQRISLAPTLAAVSSSWRSITMSTPS